MESTDTPKSTKSKRTHAATPTAVGIEPSTHQQMAKVAKSFKLTKTAYATAAISYFSERGLNPVTDRRKETTIMQDRIDLRSDRLEQLIAGLGDRLFGFLKNQERALFGFLTEQEENVYAPMVHELLMAGTDALIGRKLSERIYLELTKQGDTIQKVTADQDQLRDKTVAQRKLNFLPTVPKLKITPAAKTVTVAADTPETTPQVTAEAAPKDTY